MTELSVLVRGGLVVAAFGAGFVDAIAGGGGIITLPALLAAGLPPHVALGTNKGQSVFGSGTSLWRFSRSELLDRQLVPVTFPLGLLGSLLGALLVLAIKPEALRVVVIALLVVVAVFLTTRRGSAPPHVVSRPRLAAGLVALTLGGYDGFFGPGSGTFLIAAFVALLGRTLDRASADSKAVNFASNLAAVALFASRGAVLWSVALPMAAAQALGSVLGAHATIRGGARLVRPMVLLVVIALVAKLLRDLWVSP